MTKSNLQGLFGFTVPEVRGHNEGLAPEQEEHTVNLTHRAGSTNLKWSES